jgi:large subunit ribosomal protein L17
MYKQKKLRKLGKKKTHRESMIRGQLRGLFEHGKVKTTSQKAKALKASAESLINKGKTAKNELALRKDLQIVFGNAELVKKFMEYVAKENTGVSIVKVGFRVGDNAEISRVELLGLKKKAKKESKKEVKEEKVVEKQNSVDMKKRSVAKSIDKGATVKKTTRAKSRSGL